MVNPNVQYVARDNSRFKQADVDVIAPYLRESLFPDGIFDEDIALADAKRVGSPLHKYVDWDDSSAAQKYRINQIKDLFVCFRIIPAGSADQLPGVLNVEIKSGRSYVATDVAMKTPDLCSQALNQAIAGLKEWQRRYAMFMKYPEFAGVNAAINAIPTPVRKGATSGKTQTSKPILTPVTTAARTYKASDYKASTVNP